MKIAFLLMLGGCMLAGCAHTAVDQPANPPIAVSPPTYLPPLESAYEYAVRNASLAVDGKIAHDLIAITPENKDLVWRDSTLLVVTWKSQQAYENFFESDSTTSTSERFVVWVTAAPQVQQFCRHYWRTHPKATQADMALRLKQYLGLNHEWNYDVFVELWVDPSDLFRPCVDPEINDNHCELKFAESAPVVKGIADYPAFYKNLYFEDFRYAPGVPWTGLGYTYDWGNPLTIEGASEFILRPGSPYRLGGAIPTADYCRPGAE